MPPSKAVSDHFYDGWLDSSLIGGGRFLTEGNLFDKALKSEVKAQ